MRELNKQQRDYIAYRLEGLEHIPAVKKAYPNLTKESVYVIGSRLKKNLLVREQLEKGEKELRSVIINKQAKLIDILRELCPPVEIAKKIAELVFSGDSRVAMQAIDTYCKLANEFPDAKIGIYRDFQAEREKVLSPVDVEKLLAQKAAEIEREKILTEVEEGEVREVSAAEEKNKKNEQDTEQGTK